MKPNSDFIGKHLLLVEDESSLAQAIAEVLKHWGFDVEQIQTRQQALQRSESKQLLPDLLICDVILADGSGLEVVQAYRLQRPDFPVVLMSGGRFDLQKSPLQNSDGMVSFLRKPFSMADLLTELNRLLGHSRNLANTDTNN